MAQIETVMGPVQAQELGTVLMHEHVFSATAATPLTSIICIA
jgi:predicted metal-dependent phosphotriesterase family hydrolase